jgi:putative transcriptional regulator
MLSSINPAAGRILISEPFMMDPNFKRSVILLTEYSDMGAVGFVLNHLSDVSLQDILPGIAYSSLPVYIGGPVAHNTLHFIHRCPEKVEGGIEIWDGIFWGGDFEVIKDLVSQNMISADEVRFFIGYSGWTEGQLDAELIENTWIVANKFNPDILFSHDDNLWKETVISLGERYKHIANFPENPTLN